MSTSATAQSQGQHPAFYAIVVMLILMAVGPIALMVINSFKLDVDIISGTSGLLFLPTIQNYETALCDVLPYELDHLDFCSLKFGGAFINSLIIALVSTMLTLICLLYTSPSPRDGLLSRMPSSA